jgi:hypothetical protein
LELSYPLHQESLKQNMNEYILEVLLMYIISDVVSMYYYDLLSFQRGALCNIFNNATNVYYATTSIRIWFARCAGNNPAGNNCCFFQRGNLVP